MSDAESECWKTENCLEMRNIIFSGSRKRSAPARFIASTLSKVEAPRGQKKGASARADKRVGKLAEKKAAKPTGKARKPACKAGRQELWVKPKKRRRVNLEEACTIAVSTAALAVTWAVACAARARNAATSLAAAVREAKDLAIAEEERHQPCSCLFCDEFAARFAVDKAVRAEAMSKARQRAEDALASRPGWFRASNFVEDSSARCRRWPPGTTDASERARRKQRERQRRAAVDAVLAKRIRQSDLPAAEPNLTRSNRTLRHERREFCVGGSMTDGKSSASCLRLRFGESPIHDWGIFADQIIPAHTFILEYCGELVSPVVAERRALRYAREGRVDYLFRIDKHTVCDATLYGSLARFVNHSCDPNIVTKILRYGRSKIIALIAKRDIEHGEELSYDYMFDYEQIKIPCNCGAQNCRGFMN